MCVHSAKTDASLIFAVHYGARALGGAERFRTLAIATLALWLPGDIGMGRYKLGASKAGQNHSNALTPKARLSAEPTQVVIGRSGPSIAPHRLFGIYQEFASTPGAQAATKASLRHSAKARLSRKLMFVKYAHGYL